MIKDRGKQKVSKLQLLEEILRSHGLPLTVQRRVILEAMLGRHDHPTADKVFEELRTARPEIGRATVYRTLETFVGLGLLRRVCHPGSSVRYDPNTERHHHLVCLGCQGMVDFEDPALNRIPLPAARALGFHISDYTIQFRGLCADCRKRKKTSTSKEGKREKRR